jgi:hypothetical protein
MARLWRGLTTALVSEEPGCVNGHGSSTGSVGMDYMLLISAGLRVASDTLKGSARSGGVSGHAGICFLPYP